MITIQKTVDIETAYRFDLIAPKERMVFFDIETTGLSASKSTLYLIGAVHFSDGAWQFVQWFAESLFEEEALLSGFFGLLKEKKEKSPNGHIFLLHFNGDGFDIPYIRSVVQQHYLPFDFQNTYSIDLYKKIKPYRQFAGLPGCRLKQVEQLFCAVREDPYNGGELIYVYEEYLRLSALSKDSCEYNGQNMALREALLKALLLHNEEDILNLPVVSGVMAYEHLFEGEFELEAAELLSFSEASKSAKVLDLWFRLKTPLPKAFLWEEGAYSLSISESDPCLMNLAVTLYEGELKFFFADYKNYYYLTVEDYAIHKSVGEFVDRKVRRQATAKTCYQKRKGLFLPQPELCFAPVFYEEYKGAVKYAEWKEAYLSDKEGLKRYMLLLLKHINDRKKKEMKEA